MILNFGSPRDQELDGTPIPGTRMIGSLGQFADLSEITAAVEYFGKGYMNCRMNVRDTEVDHTLVISIGTTNSKMCPNDDLDNCKNISLVDNTALNASSGQDWANMVIEVNNAFKVARYYPRLTAAGGYDAEFGADWNSAGTMEWAQGYSRTMESNVHVGPNDDIGPNAGATAFYYNFGSCEDCSTSASKWPDGADPVRDPEVTARMDEVYMVSSGVGWAYPLPQIYLVTQGYQWYSVRWQAF